MNYLWYADGIFGGVRKTELEVNGETVFKTFKQARTALAKYFRETANEYRWSAREAMALSEAENS